jgi:hypothetical protein
MTVHKLMNGCQHRGGRELPDRIGAAQARRLLAATVGECGQWRNACGSRRRLQALVALGHPPVALARSLGISPPCLRRLLQAETQRVKITLHSSVSALYGQLWDQLPGEATGRERRAAENARAAAATAGWPPPMALDDDRIDDPAYRPRIAWRRATGGVMHRTAPGARTCAKLSTAAGIEVSGSRGAAILSTSAGAKETACHESA